MNTFYFGCVFFPEAIAGVRKPFVDVTCLNQLSEFSSGSIKTMTEPLVPLLVSDSIRVAQTFNPSIL